MSFRIAVDQKIWGWDGRHPGLTVWNLKITQELRNAHKVRKKILVFYYVAVVCTITK